MRKLGFYQEQYKNNKITDPELRKELKKIAFPVQYEDVNAKKPE